MAPQKPKVEWEDVFLLALFLATVTGLTVVVGWAVLEHPLLGGGILGGALFFFGVAYLIARLTL